MDFSRSANAKTGGFAAAADIAFPAKSAADDFSPKMGGSARDARRHTTRGVYETAAHAMLSSQASCVSEVALPTSPRPKRTLPPLEARIKSIP